MIEEKIQKLIEAIQANTEAVKLLTKQQLDYTPSDIQMPTITPEMTRIPLPPITITGPGSQVVKPTPLPEPPPPAPAPKPATTITLESLTDLALKVVSLGPEAAKRIKASNEKNGIKRISECPPEKFQLVWQSLVDLRKELGGVE